MDASSDTLSKILVVSETGSLGACWASRSQGEMVAIAEQQDELPAQFAQRASRRIGRLVREQWRPRLAILAFNDDTTSEASNARILVARAALSSMQGGSEGELVLTASARHSQAARHDMFLLAQALCEAQPGVLSVRVDLSGEASLGPGTLSAVPASTSSRSPSVIQLAS
jgi:hypothetical protein